MAGDNIIFEDMGSPIGIKSDFPSTKEQIVPNVIEGRYYSLYSELCDKCDPEKFMKEYDHDRIAIANDIYTQTQETSFYDETILKELRKRAMTELGIKFSTEIIYEELTKLLKPSKYSGTEKFNAANDLYFQTISHADDIEELERIKEDAKDFYPPTIENIPSAPNEPNPKKDEDLEGVWYSLLALIVIIVFFAFMYQLGH